MATATVLAGCSRPPPPPPPDEAPSRWYTPRLDAGISLRAVLAWDGGDERDSAVDVPRVVVAERAPPRVLAEWGADHVASEAARARREFPGEEGMPPVVRVISARFPSGEPAGVDEAFPYGVQAERFGLRHCYVTALARTHELAGWLAVRVALDRARRATAVEFAGLGLGLGLDSAPLRECVRARLLRGDYTRDAPPYTSAVVTFAPRPRAP